MKARNKRYAAILSVVTVLALALSLVAVPVPSFAATVVASPFSDVTSSTSYSTAIAFLASQGVVSGYPDGTFKPGNTITRAEMAKILVELAGKDSVAQALANLTPTFKDGAQIPSWAWGYVNAASGAGYIKGYPDGTFKANAPVTDAEAFAMFIRLLGDDWTVSGPWPTNYLIAAANVGLTSGLSSFSANVPATRGEIAQLGYNAALSAQYTTTNTANGVTVNQLNSGGLYGKNGSAITSATVTQAGTDSLTLKYGPSDKPTTKSYGVESKLTVIGASSVPGLKGSTVTAVVDSKGLVNYVEVASAAASTTKTLNDGTVTSAPSGFSLDQKGTDGSTYVTVKDANGNKYLLFADGTTVQYDQNTTVTVNTYSLGTLYGNETADLFPGATVSYTTQNGIASQVDQTKWTVQNALVTSVNPVTNVVTYKTTDGVYQVDASSASISLNGSSAKATDLQPNDVVNVEIAGSSANHTGAQTLAPATTPATAVSVDATRKTVSGTITSLSTSTTSSGTVQTVTIQPSSGSAQTLSTDSQFSGSLSLNEVVTVALDSAGKIAALLSVGGTVPGVTPVVYVTAVGQTQTSSGTTYTLTVNNAGNSVTYNIYAVSGTPQLQVNSSTYDTLAKLQTIALGAPNFFVLGFAPDGTAQSLTSLSKVTSLPDSNKGTIQVLNASSTSVTLKAVKVDGTVDQSYSQAGFSGGYLTVVSGAAFSGITSGKFIGFSGLQPGDAVDLYTDSSGHYAVVDLYR